MLGRGHYHWQHEPCWYAVRDQATGHWVGDRKQTTLWQIASRAQDTETVHGTQKPVECMRRPMENNSSPGQAVYEPFSGSGTTLIAAETSGRVCHADRAVAGLRRCSRAALAGVYRAAGDAGGGRRQLRGGQWGAASRDSAMSQGVAFQPTEEQRRTVKAMAGLGVPHEGIAVLLDIDAKTLRKYFCLELERGSVEATAKVAQSLFQLATAGKNVAAAIFWMKARAGWREKHELQVTTGTDLTQLSDEQLELMVNEGFEKWNAKRTDKLTLIDGTAEAV